MYRGCYRRKTYTHDSILRSQRWIRHGTCHTALYAFACCTGCHGRIACMVTVCICVRQWRVRGPFLLGLFLFLFFFSSFCFLLLLLLLLWWWSLCFQHIGKSAPEIIYTLEISAPAHPILLVFIMFFLLYDFDGRETHHTMKSLIGQPGAFRLRELYLLTPSFVESTTCRIWRTLSWALLQVDPQSAAL